jgi:hypothetical protein
MRKPSFASKKTKDSRLAFSRLLLSYARTKKQPTKENELERLEAAPYRGPSEEEKKRRDLTFWKKFFKGTLKHF